MSCSGCNTGRGCSTSSSGLPGGCRNNGSCGVSSCNKLDIFDWLADVSLPQVTDAFDLMEVRFKNSRKEFYRNVNNLPLMKGDVIAVEASPGHDIGVISAIGEMSKLQMKKRKLDPEKGEYKKIYRKAKDSDIKKWQEAQELEEQTMHRSRTMAVSLGLQMKISDVEYQGDKTKAIFYYTADDRVDFRELIKVMAHEFKIRIEMKQIGARQEASRLGGIGSCGRELCCSTWLTDFRSVTTGAARYQQLSLNPMKLAGQCGKLKCCLNFELETYMDAIRHFPSANKKLETENGRAVHQKTDIFKGLMWYAYEGAWDKFIPLPVERVKEIIALNEQGKKPQELRESVAVDIKEPDYENVVGQDSLTRFDKQKSKKKKKHRKNKNKSKAKKES